MNDDSTRLINEVPAPKEQTTNQSNTKQETPTVKNGKTVAAATVGGFVAGAASGAGVSAMATPVMPETELPEELTETPNEESVEAPRPEEVILANDEGIRYAHVDADNFNDAFAQARAQVGAGGVFEYNGRLYGTYLADEWDAMTPQERADYQNRVNELSPTHGAESSDDAVPSASTHTESAPENVDLISAEPVDNEIKVLGVEAVQTENGQIMNVALVENSGDQALLVDIDNDGNIDVLIHDDNNDGYLQESEIHDISEIGLNINDLQEAHAANSGDMLYASNDDMPDYINDADVTNFV